MCQCRRNIFVGERIRVISQPNNEKGLLEGAERENKKERLRLERDEQTNGKR
jgi:hypothetical protein